MSRLVTRSLLGLLSFVAIIAFHSSAGAQTMVVDAKLEGVGCYHESTTCYVKLPAANPVGPSGCVSSTVMWNSGDSNGDQVLSILMSAQLAGKVARVAVRATCHPTLSSNPHVAYVWVF